MHPPDDRTGSSRPATPCSCGRAARRSRSGITTAAPGAVSAAATDTTYSGAGLRRRRPARHDRPPGRLRRATSRALSAPGAPTGLLGGHGRRKRLALSWNAPSFDGGSQITGYRIYRGTSPGGEIFLQSVDDSLTSFPDTGLTNGQTYYYKVSAENANGEGPLSNEASATPSGLVPPLEPLPTLDDFNRPNENPLSDGGRWANGVAQLER